MLIKKVNRRIKVADAHIPHRLSKTETLFRSVRQLLRHPISNFSSTAAPAELSKELPFYVLRVNETLKVEIEDRNFVDGIMTFVIVFGLTQFHSFDILKFEKLWRYFLHLMLLQDLDSF